MYIRYYLFDCCFRRFFTFFDILGKINSREIKNLNDLQTDVTFKMFIY